MLKRDLSKINSYATIVGMMVGSGIFVAIGEAGKDAGPSTALAYLVLGPVTLLLALPYVIFQSTPLGNLAGGAYIHISRTFKNYYFAFIVMWLTWIAYLGVLSVLSISVGRYLQALVPWLEPKVAATVCLALFYVINLVGVKQFGRMQTAMFLVLILAVALIVGPGFFAIKSSNFTPFLPHGWSGFFSAMPILFFAYGGFDALSQTAGETKDASKSLPRIFILGILFAVTIYVCISLVVFGAAPYESFVRSEAPLIDAASTFLPYGALIVTTGALMAFLTTINACMMVPSRILFAFAEDRVAPRFLSRLNDRFGTPHLSLTVNFVIALALVWTKTVGYLIGISMQAFIFLYAAECLAMICLPFVNKPLWRQVPFKISRLWLVPAGIAAIISMAILYAHIPDPLPMPIVIWTAIGTVFYLYEKRRGMIERFDYGAALTAFLSPCGRAANETQTPIQCLKRPDQSLPEEAPCSV